MIIGTISDTHDRLQSVDSALKLFQESQVQLILHCGDWTKPTSVEHIALKTTELGIPLKGVLGNNDRLRQEIHEVIRKYGPAIEIADGVLELAAGNKRIAVYHGHHNPTKKSLLGRTDYDVLLLGHSHKPFLEIINGKLVINPGSTAFAIPRSKDWLPSAALYDTETNHAEIVYLHK